MLAVSIGSPAAFHCLVNFLALTADPNSFAPALTLPAAPLTAPPTLLAKLPKPRFAFAPNVFGLSNGNSPCAGSFSIKNISKRSSISIDSAFASPPPLRSNSSCSFSLGSIGLILCISLLLSSTVARAPCAAAPIAPPAPLNVSIALSALSSTAIAASI